MLYAGSGAGKRGRARHPTRRRGLGLAAGDADGGGVDLLVVVVGGVGGRGHAQPGWGAEGAGARAEDRGRVARVRPGRVGEAVGGQAGVVAEEAARELGRRRHRGGGDPPDAEAGQAAGAGQAEVGPAGELVVAVLAVVVGGGQLAVAGEGGPLEPLVGGALAAARGGARQLPHVGVGAGETGRAIGGDADHDVVVAGTHRLDPGVERVAGVLGEAGRLAAVVLVGVAVDVGPEGDHHPVGVGRVDRADRVVGRPEEGVGGGALLGHAGGAGPGPVLVGLAVGQVVVAAHLDRGAEAGPAVGRAGQQDLVGVLALLLAGLLRLLGGPVTGGRLVGLGAGRLGGAVEVGPGDVQVAVGADERLGELVLVAGAVRGGQLEGVGAGRAGPADQDPRAEALAVVGRGPQPDVGGPVGRELGPGDVDAVAERAAPVVVDGQQLLVLEHAAGAGRSAVSTTGRPGKFQEAPALPV